MTDAFLSNPMFTAGMGLYGVAAGAFALRGVSRLAKLYLQRNYFVSLETTSRDVSFDWLMRWMAHVRGFHHTSHLSVLTKRVEILPNDQVTAEALLTPAPNLPHVFWYRSRPFLIQRHRPSDRLASASGNAMDTITETLTVTTYGSDPSVVTSLLDAAKAYAANRESNKTVLYHSAGSRWIRVAEPRRRRPLSSVILDDQRQEALLKDARDFLQSAEWYHEMGIPYRRGYLLHGPPGCGKSSLVLALAGELSMAICVLCLSHHSLDDESLTQLLNASPKKCVLLLEDIDRAFHKESRVTMSGLLNALDGVAAQEGRILFLTTNHVEKLSPALIRPGRVDVRAYIGYATQNQIRSLFLRFFPNEELLAEKFIERIPEVNTSISDADKKDSCVSTISMAHLQGFLFLYREDPEGAVENVSDLL